MYPQKQIFYILHRKGITKWQMTSDFDARRSKSSVTHYGVRTIQKAKDQEKSLLPLSDPTMA